MNVPKINVFNSIKQKTTEKHNDNVKNDNNKPTKNIDYRSMPTKPIDIELMTGRKTADNSEKKQIENNNETTKKTNYRWSVPTRPLDIELMTGKKTANNSEKEQVQKYNPKDEIIPTRPIDIELMTGKKQKQD